MNADRVAGGRVDVSADRVAGGRVVESPVAGRLLIAGPITQMNKISRGHLQPTQPTLAPSLPLPVATK